MNLRFKTGAIRTLKPKPEALQEGFGCTKMMRLLADLARQPSGYTRMNFSHSVPVRKT
jgi:hypothetical protein